MKGRHLMFNLMNKVEVDSIYPFLVLGIILYFIFKKQRFKTTFNAKLIRDNIFIISNEKKYTKFKDVVNFENSEEVFKFFRNISFDMDLHLIIITEGGESDNPDLVSYMISQLKDSGYEHMVNVYIPSYAMSSGSMMMLAADNIYMNWYSCASPVDTQIEYEMEDNETFSVKYLRKMKSKGEFKERFSELIKKDAEAIYQTDAYILRRILKDNPNRKKIIKQMFDTKLSHGMNFNYHDLKNMGLNVITPIPDNILKITNRLMDRK